MSSDRTDVGILTVSDRCFKGEQNDDSGDNLAQIISTSTRFPGNIVVRKIVPDEIHEIQNTLLMWCDETRIPLIITTGGTGLSPRDVTPEATKAVIERETPGISVAMLKGSLDVTPLAMLSRSVSGVRGQSLIINLPGSKKASAECIQLVLPALSHAIALVRNEIEKVASTHSELTASSICSHHMLEPGEVTSDPVIHEVEMVARRHRVSPYPAISVATAQSIILDEVPRLPPRNVNQIDALGKILSSPIYARDPLPPFPASIKDGYAVIASDGAGNRKVVGESSAGSDGGGSDVTPGHCVRINTGAPIPSGADAVVQVEDTELVKEAEGGKAELEIRILHPPKVGQDIRKIGTDIETGQQVLEAQIKLGPSELGILATVGIMEIPVYSWPTVAVLSTGNELVEPGDNLLAGRVRDSNKTTLLALLREQGFPTFDVGIARDNHESMTQKIQAGLQKADVLITTGSVSMGDKDYMKHILQSVFQAKIHFGRVFMKPGLPTTFATIPATDNSTKKLIFGLPGNPVSATVTSHLFVLPALRKMMGYLKPLPTVIKAKLKSDLLLDPRPEYHRGVLKWTAEDILPSVISTGSQISSRLMSMKAANTLIALPACNKNKTQVSAGETVHVLVIGCI